MIHITFRQLNGTSQTILVRGGISLMEVAIQSGVDGIEALCGGACACGTCQVYVAAEWVGRTGAPAAMESEMLEAVEHRRPNSRLSCQIKIDDSFDGLTVEVPVSQALGSG